MKVTKCLSLLLSFALGAAPCTVLPMSVSAADAGTAVSDDSVDEEVIYGDIKFDPLSGGVKVYAGDTLDLSGVRLRLGTYSGYYSNFAYVSDYNCAFTVGSGEYSELYALDDSNVDLTTPGNYNVIIKPVAGAVGTFYTQNNMTSYGLSHPDGYYDICMKGNESSIPVTVYDKETAANTPLYLRFFTENIELTVNESTYIELVGAVASDISCEIADDSIASVADDSTSEFIGINGLREGETTITVRASDGRTFTENIKVSQNEVLTTTEPLYTATTTTTTLAFPGDTETSSRSSETQGTTTVTKWWYEFETTTTTTAVSSITETTTSATAGPGTTPDETTTVPDVTTAQPVSTDAQGRLVDENGNVIIINGTSAVMTSPVSTTTVTETSADGGTELPQTGHPGVRGSAVVLAVILTAGGTALVISSRKEDDDK